MESTRGGPFKAMMRILFGALLVVAFLLFVLWRTDNPRLQGLRSAVLDVAAPVLESVAGPSSAVAQLFEDVQSFSDLQAENEALKAELQSLRAQLAQFAELEEKYAALRRQSEVPLPPTLRYVRGEVIGDAGGPYGQTLLIGVGTRTGVGTSNAVEDGAPVLHDGGLIGRIFGVGDRVSRALLVTDPTSRIPVAIVFGDQSVKAIMAGDNTTQPLLLAPQTEAQAPRGARVVTTGDGGVFPRGLSVGVLQVDDDGKARVRLKANLSRVEFVTVQIFGGEDATPPDRRPLAASGYKQRDRDGRRPCGGSELSMGGYSSPLAGFWVVVTGAIAIFISLAPIGASTTTPVGPDWLFITLGYWCARRPAVVAPLIVFGLTLLYEMMREGPLGAELFASLIVCEALRGLSAHRPPISWTLEWIRFTAALIALEALVWLLLAATYEDTPSTISLAQHVGLSILVYPLAAYLLEKIFRAGEKSFQYQRY